MKKQIETIDNAVKLILEVDDAILSKAKKGVDKKTLKHLKKMSDHIYDATIAMYKLVECIEEV